jgi:hypothetical protein
MISTYRFGDLVLLNNVDENELLNDHPNSFASKYILEKRNNINNMDNIDILTKVVLDNIENIMELLPKDILDCTVIHLRLGDVVAGNEWHEKIKRPFDIDYIKSLVKDDSNKKYIIGKCFFAGPSSRNYDECIHKSNEYLQNAIHDLNAEYFDSGNADIDLCCAVKSKLFIQGRGFFSKLIVEIRKKLNLNTIETAIHD